MKVKIQIDEAAFRASIRAKLDASGLEHAIRSAVDEEAARVNALYANNTLECAVGRLIHKTVLKVFEEPLPEGSDTLTADVGAEDFDKRILDHLKGSDLGRVLSEEVTKKALDSVAKYPQGSLKHGLATTIFSALVGRTIKKQFPAKAAEKAQAGQAAKG